VGRPARSGCGSGSASLDWAWAEGNTTAVPSSGFPPATAIPFTPFPLLFTNAPGTFDIVNGGIRILRGGYYRTLFMGFLTRNVAIAALTKRAWMIPQYTAPPSSIDTLEEAIVEVGFNYSLTGATAGSAPQKWRMSSWVANNYPDTAVFPTAPQGLKLGQESGGNADGNGLVYIERIADGIP
jgi:hypothetical protein